MRQPKINRERSARAELAIQAGGYERGEDCSVTDLLCDLRHLCDREGWDFDNLNRIGADHHDAELQPDDIEESARAMHRRGDYPILPADQQPASV